MHWNAIEWKCVKNACTYFECKLFYPDGEIKQIIGRYTCLYYRQKMKMYSRRWVYGWIAMPTKLGYTFIYYYYLSLWTCKLINVLFDVDDRQFENKTFDCVGKTPSQPRHWPKACQSTFIYYYYVDASRVVVSNVTFLKYLKYIGSLLKRRVLTTFGKHNCFLRMTRQMIKFLFLLTYY